MDSAEIAKWDHLARRDFTYLADPANRDNWRSHADLVLKGIAWRGDCDDLASTTLDLLGRAGLPLNQRYRLLVDSSRHGSIDHMIAAVRDAHGLFWIVGDTFGPVYQAPACQHRVMEYQRMDEWNNGQPVWRSGAPWG